MTDLTTIRECLRRGGYAPLPLAGKRPPMDAWSKKTDVNLEEIRLWPKLYPFAANTGMLTATTPVIDIDILSPEAADAVERLARVRFEEHGRFLVRIGRAPKRAIPFRTNVPFKKIQAALIAPNETEHNEQKIEILGDGQQICVAGIHPEVHKPYAWHGGVPWEIPAAELPLLSEDDARAFLEDAVELLISEYSYGRAGSKVEDAPAERSQAAVDWTRAFANIQSGASLHDTLRDLAASMIAHGAGEAATVKILEAAMQASPVVHDDRWRERFRDIRRAVAGARKFQPEQLLSPLPWIDMSTWDDEPVPESEWAVLERIPLRQVTLFSGEGAAGKSTEQLHLSAAHVLARDWLGTTPEPGPAVFIDAEDDRKVLHRRLAAIVKHYGVTFKDLVDGGLHALSLTGLDPVLAAANRGGRIEPTSRYRQLLEAAGDIRPKMIGIASSANVYAGSEIDRSQVQQFIDLLTAVAQLANGALVLISHPSLAGIATDTGLSGNTQWHNAVRARFYMKGVKPEAGEQPDSDLREIVFKKNNYGPISESIVLRYQDGLFLPVPGVASLDRLAREAKADEIFLDLLRGFTAQNRRVSSSLGSTYAPALFAKEEASRKAGIGAPDLANAMRRLFGTGKIYNEPHGKPSRERFHLATK
jgi:RecA-family ATPase